MDNVTAEQVVQSYNSLVEASWTPEKEDKFQKWFSKYAKKLELDPNPDHPLHKYNWRAAYMTKAKPDKDGHWPSTFKHLDHPNRFVDGKDTIVWE